MDPNDSLKEVTTRCLHGINEALGDLQDELEDAELDELQDQFSDVLPKIRYVVNQDDRGEKIIALTTPFYTLAGIPPSSVRTLEEIDPGGMLVLAAGLRMPDGRLTRFLSDGRDGAAMVLTDADDETIIHNWRKAQPRLSPFADHGVRSPMNLMDGTDHERLGGVLWKAFEAAVYHATRWYPEKPSVKAVSRIRVAITPYLNEITQTGLQCLADECHGLVNTQALEKSHALGVNTLGGYNYLTRKVDPELYEKRIRVIETFPRFAPILTDFSIDSPGSLQHDARATVDAGEPLRAFMAQRLGCNEKVMKQILSMDLPPGEDSLESPVSQMQGLVLMLRTIPNQRWPKTVDEVRSAMAMRESFVYSEKAAKVLGVSATSIWEGALKAGWDPMIKKFSALRSLDRKPHPPDALLTGNLILYALQGPSEIANVINVAIKNKKVVLPNGVNGQAVASMLYEGKTLFRMAEFADWFERVRADVSAKLVTKGADCTWYPLFPKNKVQNFDGVEFVELTSTAELVHEGRTMDHCVGGYTSNCLSGGDRIFHVTDKRAPRGIREAQVGTLDIGVSSKMTARRRTFLSVHDHQVQGRLRQAAEQFVERINAGELNADLAAHQRDLKMSAAGANGYADLLAVDLFDALEKDSGALLPKNAKEMGLTRYIKSDAALEWMKRHGYLEPEPAPFA